MRSARLRPTRRGEPLRAAERRREAEIDLGLAEFGALARDRERRRLDDLAAAAVGETVDGDDDRLRKALDRAVMPLATSDELAQRGRLAAPHAGRKTGDVGARREGALARAGEHDGADVVIRLDGVEDRHQAVDQRRSRAH